MTSHLPLAFSLLQALAAQYQKPAPAPAVPTFPSVFAVPPASASSPPAPVANPTPAVQPTTGGTPSTAAGTNPPSSNLCDNCHIRPKYNDGTKTHPYCTKGCANQVKANATSSTNTSSPSGNCDFCHNRPKHFDGTRTHPFCSKACAKKAKGAQRSPSINVNIGASNGPGICQAPGCQKPAHTNANGSIGDYCSMAHKTLADTICLMCRVAPKQAHSHFCSKTCAEDAEKRGPMIMEVPVGHVTFKSVADQFKSSWRHASTCPPVKGVYKIVAPQASLASYNAYRAAVEARGQFVAAGRSAGNENRRWHGTRRECNFGDQGQTQMCTSTTCSLCCIVRTSFDLSCFGKKTGWGRFGKGIYTSSTSSKSNDYCHNDCQSNLKAMILSKVIVGKGCKMTQDNTTLTAPPAGYDSVLAEKGGSLNYDELVVYANDAIRPSFLVMYEP